MAAEPFVGQIQAFGFQFTPMYWLPCDGRALPISQYDVLFTLIGTTYGGDGVTTFNIPDLRGRVALHMGQGQGLSARPIGSMSGHESITLTTAQMPSHTHILTATGGEYKVSSQNGVSPTPSTTNNVIGAAFDVSATATNNAYNNQMPDILLNTGASSSATVSVAGGNQPFENMEPYLAINYCIATEGIFPQRS
jgi:microcystin-dependent protein